MLSFHSTFYTFGGGSADPENWKSYFLNYDPAKWNEEGDGGLHFADESEEIRYSLIVAHYADLGFSLWQTTSLKKKSATMISVNKPVAIGEFVEVDDFNIPLGSFLPPEDAWLAVEDFLHEPRHPSKRIEWIASDELPWPPL